MKFFRYLFKIGTFFYNHNNIICAKFFYKLCLLDKSIRAQSLLNLTYLYQYSKKKYDFAIKLLEKELKIYEDIDLEYQLAFFYSLKNDHIKSKEIYETILNRYILRNEIIDQQLIENLINSYNELKEYSKAIELFKIYKEQVDKLDTNINNSGIFYNLGNTYLATKDNSEAINYYRYALKYNTDNINDIDKSDIFYNMGYGYYNLKDYDNSIEYFNKSLNNIKNNSFEKGKAMAGIGYCYREKNLYEEAIKYFKQAVELGYTKAQEDIDYIVENKKIPV